MVGDGDEFTDNGGENGQRVDVRWRVVWSCRNGKRERRVLIFSYMMS